MKKLLTLILTAFMVLSFAACADVNSTQVNNESNQSQNDTDANSENNLPQNEENDTAVNGTTAGYEKEELVFTEVIVVNNDECMIKITEINPDDMWGYELKAYLENKSADKIYMFSVDSAAINGIECDPFFATEVAAGKKANKSISFPDSTLKENGIEEFTDIELTFRVYDSNDWNADNVAYETIHVYPYGETNATNYIRTPQETDIVLIDNAFVTAIVTGYEEDNIWGYTVNLFFVNKTNSNVMFSVDSASINGYMADPFYAISVGAGKCSFGSMSWSDTVLAENAITTINEIEFNLRVYDEDDWNADDFANETITLTPQK